MMELFVAVSVSCRKEKLLAAPTDGKRSSHWLLLQVENVRVLMSFGRSRSAVSLGAEMSFEDREQVLIVDLLSLVGA